MLNFLRNCQTLSYSDYTFYILASSVGEFQFLCIFTNTCYNLPF